MLDFDISV